MRQNYIKHRLWFRVVALSMVCLFMLNDISFAAPAGMGQKPHHALCPASRFNPTSEIFREDAGGLYISCLIGRVLHRYGSGISANGLKRFIEKHISHIGDTDFKWRELYKEGATFCVPFRRKGGGKSRTFRYYLPGDRPAEALGKVSVPVGEGSARVIFEGQEKIAALKKELDEQETRFPLSSGTEKIYTIVGEVVKEMLGEKFKGTYWAAGCDVGPCGQIGGNWNFVSLSYDESADSGSFLAVLDNADEVKKAGYTPVSWDVTSMTLPEKIPRGSQDVALIKTTGVLWHDEDIRKGLWHLATVSLRDGGILIADKPLPEEYEKLYERITDWGGISGFSEIATVKFPDGSTFEYINDKVRLYKKKSTASFRGWRKFYRRLASYIKGFAADMRCRLLQSILPQLAPSVPMFLPFFPGIPDFLSANVLSGGMFLLAGGLEREEEDKTGGPGDSLQNGLNKLTELSELYDELLLGLKDLRAAAGDAEKISPMLKNLDSGLSGGVISDTKKLLSLLKKLEKSQAKSAEDLPAAAMMAVHDITDAALGCRYCLRQISSEFKGDRANLGRYNRMIFMKALLVRIEKACDGIFMGGRIDVDKTWVSFETETEPDSAFRRKKPAKAPKRPRPDKKRRRRAKKEYELPSEQVLAELQDLVGQEDYSSAEELLLGELDYDPENVHLLAELAHLYYQTDNFPQAKGICEQVLASDPDNFRAQDILLEISLTESMPEEEEEKAPALPKTEKEPMLPKPSAEMKRFAERYPDKNPPELLEILVAEEKWNLAGELINRIKSAQYAEGLDIESRYRIDDLEKIVAEATEEEDLEKGRYRWSTRRQAIKNIRYAVGANRPDIIQRYDNIDSLSPAQIEALRMDIYNISSGHFRLWGLNSIFVHPDYFGRSHSTALIAAFPGLDLDPLGFQLDRSSREKALGSARYVLKREAPHLVDAYDNLENLSGRQKEVQIEALREQVYRITHAHFQVWGLRRMQSSGKREPYLGRSYIQVLGAVFPELDLDPLGFQLNWSTEEKALESVRYVLKREAPHLVDAYENLENLSGRQREAQIEDLKGKIYRVMHAHFQVWGLGAIINKKMDFLGGSFITALIKTFPELDLDPLGFQLKWSTRRESIRSVKFVLKREVPHIMERYANLDDLDEAEIERLKEDICLITSAHFKVWNLARVLIRKAVPYFRGSYIRVLLAVFKDERLGLSEEEIREFRKRRFQKQYSWREGKEAAIANIKDALERNRPDITQRYAKLNELTPERTEKLKDDIYRITAGHFGVWGIDAALNKKYSAPYFGGSYINALIAAFPELGLDPLGFQFRWSTEQEGIASVRFALEREVPHIMERYRMLSALSEDEIEELKKKIYKITNGHFLIWGIRSATNRHRTPYFKGSHVNALRAVFPELDLDPLGFQLDWSSEERAIASVRFVLQREAPHIIREYDDLASLDQGQRELLKRRIYNIDQGHFRLWGLNCALNSALVPYFGGSHSNALMMMFPELDLDPLGFKLDWSTRNRGIASVRFVFMKEAPHMIEQYDRLDKLNKKEIEELRQAIYGITMAHFSVWGLSSALDRDKTPYFRGSYINALLAVFDDPGLGLTGEEFRGKPAAETGKAPPSAAKTAPRSAPAVDEKTAAARTAKKIIKWCETGRGLKAGDTLAARVEGGRFIHIRAGRKKVKLPFYSWNKKGEDIDVVLVARKDVNHGFVLNCYRARDYRAGDASVPEASFIYCPAKKKPLRIHLGAADIVTVYHSRRRIKSTGRPFRTRINKGGAVHVSTYSRRTGSLIRAKLLVLRKNLREGDLIGREVVALVEDDRNHGRVINVYLASEYNNGRRDKPVTTYKYHKRLKRGKSVLVDLAGLDVIAAYEGRKLELTGRTTSVNIEKGNYGHGVCFLWFMSGTRDEKRVQFSIPKEYMEKGALGKPVIIRVERDVNRGQIINIYLESEFNSLDNPVPLTTYKYFPGLTRHYKTLTKRGVCTNVDLAALDIRDYYRGKNIKPVAGRVLSAPITYSALHDSYRAETKKSSRSWEGRMIFSLSGEANRIFKPDSLPQAAEVAVKEDPDYGPYIEVSYRGTVLSTYYYLKGPGQCKTVDLSRLALIDYALGKKNVHGKPVRPRQFRYPGKVTAGGRVGLDHRDRKYTVKKLGKSLKGKEPVFVPVEDEKYGYLIQVHDAAEYEKNTDRRPECVLLKDARTGALVPPSVNQQAQLERKRLLASFIKDKEAIRQFADPEEKRASVLEELARCSGQEREELTKEVSEIEERPVKDEEDLRTVLAGWLDAGQMAAVLNADKSGLRFRIEAGDIRSFIHVGRVRLFHPVKVLSEYIHYQENKKELIARRQLKAIIQALHDTDPEKFAEFARFIKDEAGVSVGDADEAWNACREWFNIRTYAEHLGLDRNTVNKLIIDRDLKTFRIEASRGKPIELVSPKSVDRTDKEIRDFLDDVERWHEENLGAEIEIPSLKDFYKWTRLMDLPKIFPFVGIYTFRRMTDLKAYKAQVKHLIFHEIYVPAAEVARLKKEVVDLLRDKKTWKTIKKQKLVPQGLPPGELDYRLAKRILRQIRKEWLSIGQFSAKIGQSDQTVRTLIRQKEVDHVKLSIFSSTGVYYIAPEGVKKIKDKDKKSLEIARRFLEERCGVKTGSLSKVKSLLEKHCMTAPQVAERLGIWHLKRASALPDTVVISWIGSESPLVYLRKQDAEELIKGEQEKFKAVKEQMGRYSDVSHVKNISELMEFLESSWKTARQLSDELGSPYSSIMGAFHKGRIFAVSTDFINYKNKVYFPPSTKSIETAQEEREPKEKQAKPAPETIRAEPAEKDRLKEQLRRSIAGKLKKGINDIKVNTGYPGLVNIYDTSTGELIARFKYSVRRDDEFGITMFVSRQNVYQFKRHGIMKIIQAYLVLVHNARTIYFDSVTDDGIKYAYGCKEQGFFSDVKFFTSDSIRAVVDRRYAELLLKGESNVSAEFTAEDKEAQDFIDTVILLADEAKGRKEKIIIGIDTSWIPGMQRSAVQGLLNKLTHLSQRRGLNNVIVERETGEDLSRLLSERAEETGTPLANMIILGDRKVLKSNAFDPLRNPAGEKTGAFFAEIVLPEDFPETGYVRLLEMLTIALDLAFGEQASLGDPYIRIVKDAERTVQFMPLPDAKPLGLDDLKKKYQYQARVVAAAA